jgi:hypothetical protein
LRMTAVVDDLDDLAGPRRHQQQQMLEAIAAYGLLARTVGDPAGAGRDAPSLVVGPVSPWRRSPPL